MSENNIIARCNKLCPWLCVVESSIQLLLVSVNVPENYFTECGFPNAVGLKYIDEGSEEPVLLLQRNEKFTPPADGWQKDGRVYTPQEVVATTPTAGTFIILS